MSNSNIIELDKFRKKHQPPGKSYSRIIRLSAELDGMEILYANEFSNERLFAIKILFWALFEDGSVQAMIPWLNSIISSDQLEHPNSGKFHGFYDPDQDLIMFQPPKYKVHELQTAHNHFAQNPTPDAIDFAKVSQELPDHLGTHAAFKHPEKKGFYLKPVISWRLLSTGRLNAMVPEEQSEEIRPLAGSDDLIEASSDSNFRYFFQHSIASRIKLHDPDTMTAVALLIDLV